jgi:hypothetical protein
MPRLTKPFDLKLLIAAAGAGVLYNSWPLGYVLNPVANRGLASNLEGLGQSYNWLFIVLDILSGLVVVATAVILYDRNRRSRHWLLDWSIISYGLFGFLTALDALVPVDCLDTVQRCNILSGHPLIILHGLASLGSIGFLTFSIIGLWYLLAFEQRAVRPLRWLLYAIGLGWFGFGIATGVFLLDKRSSALSQHLFIVVCALWIALLPYLVFVVVNGPRLVREKVVIN